MDSGKNFLIGVYDDDEVLLNAVKKVRGTGVKIYECYTPFPVHGLDHALGYKPSRLPVAAFMFGLLGTTLGLVMMYWMMGIDWPMNIGGKDFASLPPFIPITFEITVLLASLGMVAVFFVVSNLKPYGQPVIFDIRSTDDKHLMVIDKGKNKKGEDELRELLKESGAEEVNNKDF